MTFDIELVRELARNLEEQLSHADPQFVMRIYGDGACVLDISADFEDDPRELDEKIRQLAPPQFFESFAVMGTGTDVKQRRRDNTFELKHT